MAQQTLNPDILAPEPSIRDFGRRAYCVIFLGIRKVRDIWDQKGRMGRGGWEETSTAENVRNERAAKSSKCNRDANQVVTELKDCVWQIVSDFH